MYKTRIYYQDTDAGGVVYFANYLKFAEKSWFEYLLSIGIDLMEWQSQDTYIIVKTVHLDLMEKILYGDTITVKTEVKEVKNAYFILEHTVLKDEKITTRIETTMVCISSQGRPKRIPDGFKDKLLKQLE
ncbi:MAG TPA: thioesterase family protein [Syntrophorhabdaceae bacterium]|nr:thioesterase family protein [Syntrophorhabdaceae bacterium]HOL05043.1 thioesterase family protein [Syntrophorhabdaceae bacterium]HPC66958.1 thioesterase family protein [Syntrophorhabdaceae bacterium]HPP41267.1 thioesterase family protein [Syntrophorhabdaceae bacterium]HRV22640.1 thioesterase family protein [Syntrophorhabdaceae bacterium]